MNADQMYEEFKDALKVFELSWNQKEKMEVYFEDGHLVLKSINENKIEKIIRIPIEDKTRHY